MVGTRLESQARRVVAREGGFIERPIGAGGFQLAYVRTGPSGGMPVVVLPGGPGLASALPYAGMRKLAASRGLDVVMVEHRGVGVSGTTTDGELLPPEAVTVEAAADDVAAVLDHLNVEKAIIAGSSYGSYLAQVLAIRHPSRVHALVLDSPMLSPQADLETTRRWRRSLLWDGSSAETREAAALVRRLAGRGEPLDALGHVVQLVYEFAGAQTLARLLQAHLDGRLGWLWGRLATLGTGEIDGKGTPFYMEPDPVAGISFGQLGYGLPLDGGPLDPQTLFASIAANKPPFRGTPVDLETEVPCYSWPVVVLSGDRDLRTPRPVAQQIVNMAPQGVLVPLADTGHSALDTHQLAFIQTLVILQDQGVDGLTDTADRLADLPRKGVSGMLGPILTTLIRVATAIPVPRLGRPLRARK